ncbi:MAG TPA: hypothetical protein EYQ61_07745 [Dehalococcoidia bacterium]|nr:hypothetical protein [Dehalococcoidia bacterium]
MFNLIHARFLPRLGLVTGAYLLWAVVFLSVGEFRVSPAENLVMVPVMLTAILFGMRGGAIGVLVAIFGISTLGVVAGVAPFTRLLHGSAPYDLAMMTSVMLMVGYGRYLETSKVVANRRADSTIRQLDQMSSESRILSTLSSDVGKLLTTESILVAAGEAISQIVDYHRLSIYQIDFDRVTVKLTYVSGESSTVAMVGSTYRLAEIMALDPYDNELALTVDDTVPDQPRQILHRSIGSNSKPMAFVRVWSRNNQNSTVGERQFISSIATLIVPVLKRAALQARFEQTARSNSAV